VGRLLVDWNGMRGVTVLFIESWWPSRSGEARPRFRLSLIGEFGLECTGDGKDDVCAVPEAGDSVKRYILASICQNVLRVTYILLYPASVLSSILQPTLESSVVIKPILSSFASKFFPLNMPSLLMCIFQSPRGRPSSAVRAESAVMSRSSGSGWWKYQYRVALKEVLDVLVTTQCGPRPTKASWLSVWSET
jgi:hypothetical protein